MLSHVKQQIDNAKGGTHEEDLEAFQSRLQETPGANLAEMLKAAQDDAQSEKKAFNSGLLKGCLMGAAGVGVALCPLPGAQVVGIALLTGAGCVIAGARSRVGECTEAKSFEEKLASQAEDMAKNFNPVQGNPDNRIVGATASGHQDLSGWNVR